VKANLDYAAGYRAGFKDGHADTTTKEANALFKTPDVTPAQIVSVVGAALAVAAAFGFDLNQDQRDSVLQLVTILSSVLVVGDAAVRHGRATGNAKKNGE
jgi:hypothetical protein